MAAAEQATTNTMAWAVPNHVAAAAREPGRLWQRSVALARAPNTDALSRTTKSAASERYQFNIGYARPISMIKSQKINSTFPGEGSSGDEAAPAANIAPTTPTAAASMVAARREFNTRSEVRPRVVEVRNVSGLRARPTSESRKYSSSVLSVAARPSDASTIHARARASVSTTSATAARGALPWKMRARACAIKAGWRVRNKSISPAVTGRVPRNSRSENRSTAI